MSFSQFSNMTTYVRVVGKMQDQHFNVWLFSNPRDKVLILVESRGQIWPIVFLLFWTLSPGLEKKDELKCYSGFFQQPWYMWSSWKIYGATLDGMVVLQSRGQDLNCCWNLISQDLRLQRNSSDYHEPGSEWRGRGRINQHDLEGKIIQMEQQ